MSYYVPCEVQPCAGCALALTWLESVPFYNNIVPVPHKIQPFIMIYRTTYFDTSESLALDYLLGYSISFINKQKMSKEEVA